MNKNATNKKLRPRFAPEERRQLLEAFKQRNEPARDFARRHGVATSTLHRWMGTEGGPRATRAKPLEFREVHLAAGTVSGWTGEVCLPDGTLVRWNGAMGLAGAERLVHQLRRPC